MLGNFGGDRCFRLFLLFVEEFLLHRQVRVDGFPCRLALLRVSDLRKALVDLTETCRGKVREAGGGGVHLTGSAVADDA